VPIIPASGSSAFRGSLVPIAYSAPSGVTNVVFTNIPQTYQDLRIVVNIQTAGNTTLGIQFNQDGSGVYGYTQFSGRGGTLNTNTAGPVENLGNCSGQYYYASQPPGLTPIEIDILNYTNTSTLKFGLVRGGTTPSGLYSFENWLTYFVKSNNTNAVTSVTFLARDGQNFLSGSEISIYGVRSINQ